MLGTSLRPPTTRHNNAVVGFYQRWMPASWTARAFMLITLAEAVVNISIEAVLLSRYSSRQGLTRQGSGELQALPVFVLCFCLAHSYQVLLSIDACINRNTILIVGLAIFNACFLVYSLIQIGEIRQVLGTGVVKGSGQTVPVQILTGAIPVVIGTAQVAYLILGWFLWKEFGWQVYKAIIGADRILKKAYQEYQIYVVLLKFDFFVFIAFCLQVSRRYSAQRDWQAHSLFCTLLWTASTACPSRIDFRSNGEVANNHRSTNCAAVALFRMVVRSTGGTLGYARLYCWLARRRLLLQLEALAYMDREQYSLQGSL